MEIFSLKSPPSVSRLPSSLLRRDCVQKPTSFFGQSLARKSNPDARNASFPNYRLSASVFAQLSAGSISRIGDLKQDESSKDNDIVFVAGATGRVGSRTVRQLLKRGFRVRAGVRSAKRAETLVQSVRQMETQPIEKLEIVECDLENESSISSALGNASMVICCIGASEKEVFDITGPYRIDYKATKNLIDAATAMKVDHFILLTSLGTNKIGFPAAILNLFWGVLCWKRKAEEALISSGLPYTIVRPGGMERPTDSYKETHNIILANEDTYFGGQVSNLQVAELMAVMAKHRRLSLCKVVEVIAETTAPLTPMDELLAKIPPKQELPAEPKPDPIPTVKTESEPAISTVDKEVDDEEVPKPKPLSPFAMYADLKPPTSPCPTPSTGAAVSKQKIEDPVQDEPTTTSHTKMKSDNASNQKEYHLSPYIAYENLKPPTSPTPTPSTISKALNNGPATTSRTAPPNVNEKEVLENSSHLSPYYVYDDLKPPTSPMPITPSTSSFISTSAVIDNSPSSAPLSPYTMYEDLKPPTSPVPSVPKY